MSSGTGILVYNIWHLMNGKNTQNTETGRAQKEKLQSEKRKIGLMFLVICFLHFISLSGCPPHSSTIFNGTQNKAKLSAFSSNLTLAHVLCLPPGSSSGVSAVGVVFKMSSHLSPPPTIWESVVSTTIQNTFWAVPACKKVRNILHAWWHVRLRS